MNHEDDTHRRLLDFWDRSHDYYELAVATNPEAAPEREFLFRFLDGGEKLLDLGCGACENALWLPDGCHYIGTDVSTTGLAMATEMSRPGCRFRSDGASLPVADRSFDAVLSTWAIEHFHDPGKTLAEMIRVLRMGGLLLLVGSSWDLPYVIPPSLPPGRRIEVGVRRMARHLRSLVDGRHRFDIVRTPRALSEEFVPDADAVHVTQSFLLCRFLQAAGMRILEHDTLPHQTSPSWLQRALRRILRLFPLWRYGWGNTLIVAQRRDEKTPPPYELNYL